MKGIFIPEITVEMFRDGCLESIETLMTEGEVYDIEYDPKFEETDVPDINVGKSISRQAAIDAIERNACNTQRAIDAVKVLPSVEPERKKGKWIDKSGGIEDAWNYCSVCGEQAIDLYDFCPNCGADMR